MTAADKAVNMGKFWFEMGETKYGTLRELGMWWAEVPSSSVAVERAFAFMRTVQDKDRYSMKEESFRAEMAFKVNGWLLDTLWRPAAVAAVGALPDAKRPRQPGPPAGEEGLEGDLDINGDA